MIGINDKSRPGRRDGRARGRSPAGDTAPEAGKSAEITAFHDEVTGTAAYVVADPATGSCTVIDPVLDYDPRSGRTSTGGLEMVAGFVREKGLAVAWLVETHAHADHMSGAVHP